MLWSNFHLLHNTPHSALRVFHRISWTSIFRSPRDMKSSFEIVGFRNNWVNTSERDSAWLRNSRDFELTEFEIARFDCTSKRLMSARHWGILVCSHCIQYCCTTYYSYSHMMVLPPTRVSRSQGVLHQSSTDLPKAVCKRKSCFLCKQSSMSCENGEMFGQNWLIERVKYPGGGGGMDRKQVCTISAHCVKLTDWAIWRQNP